MHYLILAVLLVGCGGNGMPQPMTMPTGAAGTNVPPMATDLTWAISFRGGSWVCNGPMNTHNVTHGTVIDMTGSWNCSGLNAVDASAVTMGGSLTGRYTPGPETVTLSLGNGASAIPVDGTLGPAGIVGVAHFSNAEVPFTAQ